MVAWWVYPVQMGRHVTELGLIRRDTVCANESSESALMYCSFQARVAAVILSYVGGMAVLWIIGGQETRVGTKRTRERKNFSDYVGITIVGVGNWWSFKESELHTSCVW